jgi:DNA polymerase II
MGKIFSEGWIFDAYPEENGIRVWVITGEGRHQSFLDPWNPCLFVGDGAAAATEILRALPYPAEARYTEKREIFSGRMKPVLEIRVAPSRYFPLAKKLQAHKLELFDADVHLVQAYHYDRRHFPLAKCAFETEGDALAGWELKDDPWALEYELPPLQYLHMALTGSEVAGRVDPNHAVRGNLALTWDKTTHVLEGAPEEQLESLARYLRDLDPDVITTEWGDSHILPWLAAWARRCRMTLPFSRDAKRSMAGRGDRSFYTYGRTVYQSGIKYLFGRWHLDVENSFYLRECGLDGLFEMARVARIPVQRASRCTIGTSLTSMQMAEARRQGVLIPTDKQQVEDFRSAADLVTADKGGLVYEPEIGWFENVAEYDFTSMYPQMMVTHNISPETVNCPCCRSNKVPEIGHNLCRRRQGIVPAVLAPILKKRAKYKALAKQAGSSAAVYKNRATAFKWVLVCCFGYLGFKNARFGKIESHECVTAWGREVLLRAKEAVERLGFSLLHANVDAVYVQARPETDYERIRRAIEKEAGCPVGLEGVYKWLRFCPSRTDSKSGVPNKYFGSFRHGETKVRGLSLRRRDTPRLVKQMQADMIRRLDRETGLDGCRAAVPDLEAIAADYRDRLRTGQVTVPDLAITFHLSKDPKDYVHDTLSSIAAKKLEASGVKLHPGETLQYVICSARDKVKDWRALPVPLIDVLEYDPSKYLELLARAEREILDGLEG